jgi:ABC-type transport system substrate-binding protein
MSDADLSQPGRAVTLTVQERRELDQLVQTFRETSPKGSRRDLLRWSAIAAGALATARLGVASAAPSATSPVVGRFQNADIQKDVTITIPLDPYGQPVTLDPHRTVNWGAFWVMFPNVWGGLVRYDENAKVQLDLAESYTVSEDGTVYQFKIRPDAKYANGHQVKAGDFVTSWKRALDPSRLSPMAQYMQHIKGFTSYVSRKSKTLAVKAVDDATVEITLSKPYSYFMSYLAAFVWAVVDPAVLQSNPDDFFLHDAGTGPWRITAFDESKQLVMEPNPNHYGGNSPSITKLVWSFVTGPSAANEALNLYKQDKAISADVPLSLMSSVQGDPDLSKELKKIAPQGTTRSLAMDFAQPPFNDVRVRRAFAQAIDRDKWANQIWEGTWAPAQSFTPPVVAANSGYKPPELLGFDAGAAKKALEDAGFKDGKGLPAITYYEPSEDLDDEKSRWQAFLDMIKENLGVVVTLDASKSQAEIQKLQDDNGGRQFDIVWWWNITETPHLLTDVFASTSPYMKGVFNWSSSLKAAGGFDPGADSKAFDDLVTKADVELDAATRNDQYRQAEELAIKNAVYVPLGHWVQMYVQKTWLQGTKQGSWTGRLPVLFDKNVVVVKH